MSQKVIKMDNLRRYIKEGVNAVYFSPRVLLGYLPDDIKSTVCASLDIESLDDESLRFGYDAFRECYTVSSSFEYVVNVKSED